MKASRKNLVFSVALMTVLIGLIGIMWVVDPVISRVAASATLFIYAIWVGYLADLIIEVRGEWSQKTAKRVKRRLLEKIKAEPFGILTDLDVERIFKEFENEPNK